MRCALVVAVLAAPAAAAGLPPISGQILFSEGTGDQVHGPWIDLAECTAAKTDPTSAAALVNLSWVLPTYPAGGSYRIFASSAAITTTRCPTVDNVAPDYRAGPVGPALGNLGASVDLQPLGFADVFSAIQLVDCAAVPGDVAISVCAQAYDAFGNDAGIATGTMTLSVSAPGAPVNVIAVPADDGALQIAWSAPAGDPPAFDYRIVARAEPPDPRDTSVHEVTDVRALSYVMSGLVDDVPYRVRVHARSQAGNESVPAAGPIATPVAPPCAAPCVIPARPGGGGGGGGCGAGGAGPLALLAAAALLARRHRAG